MPVFQHPRWWKTHLPLLAAIAAGVICLVPALYVGNAYIATREAELVESAEQDVEAVAAKLEGLLNSNLSVARVLRNQIVLTGGLSQEELNHYGDAYLGDLELIRNLALAPDLVISAVYPLAGNENVLGLDYRQLPSQRDAVLRAMHGGRILLAGPVALVQNGAEALIARVPVKLPDGSNWGMIALVLEVKTLFEAAGVYQLSADYRVSIRGRDGSGHQGEVFYGDGAVFSTDAIFRPVVFTGGSWQLAIIPGSGWSLPTQRVLLIRLLGLVLSLMLATLLYLFLKHREDRRNYLELMESRARTDQLTGLINRYEFSTSLAAIMDECSRKSETFALLFVDIDNFKEINDSLGHGVGDQLLTAAAERLKSYIRTYDLLARVGGDEFIAVLKDNMDTNQLVARIRDIMNSMSRIFPVEGRELSVSVSVGVALYPNDGITVDSLIQHADRAMYSAKKMGRNTFQFFDRAMRAEADRYVLLQTEMLRALKEEQFVVYYQPILNIKTEKFERCEALMRWPHPDRGMISPGEFIPVAEQSGIIRELGKFLCRAVVDDAHTLSTEGFALKYSLNRSMQEFNSRDSTDSLIELLEYSTIDSEDITIEITESLLMTGSPLQLESFERLESSGCCFAIDDFGTGYSSINYLRKYPVDMLKIDRSFVADLEHSSQACSLVNAFLQIADALKIDVCAEGVETMKQLEFLRDAGCDYAQGFVLSRPLPFEEFKAFLKEHAH